LHVQQYSGPHHLQDRARHGTGVRICKIYVTAS
jgi:hypothetical protein